MEITYKKLETEEEIKGKAYVLYKEWHETYKGMIDPSYLESLTLDKFEKVSFQITENNIIAKDNNRVIGFVFYGNREETSDIGEVFAIYVLDEYHGKGIAKTLMSKALENLNNYKKILVWVLKENKRAINFYQKCGFEIDGEEKYSERLKAFEIELAINKIKSSSK